MVRRLTRSWRSLRVICVGRSCGVEIVLCEGKNDEEFLSKILAGNYSVHDYSEKDRIMRRIYGTHGPGDRFFIIREEGKSRLEKNLRVLISKLRSISRALEVFVLVDSDGDSTIDYRSKLYRVLEDYVNDRRKFPRTPKLSFKDEDRFHGIVRVTYSSGRTLTIHVFVIPRNLEHWINKEELDTINRILSKLRHIDWFKSLTKTLRKLGLTTHKNTPTSH